VTTASVRRAVILTACRAPGAALSAKAQALAEHHDDVVVAVDDHDALGALPARWAAAQALLATVPHAWATPLVHTSTLQTPADRLAALAARVGRFDTLVVEQPTLQTLARALDVDVELAPRLGENGAVPAALLQRRRAVVVLRAQPVHVGHVRLLEQAAALADEVIVVVAAAEQAYSQQNPFTAGERLQLLRASLSTTQLSRCWLVALPSPAWAAMAVTQLRFCLPAFDVIVTNNPVLQAMAEAEGIAVVGCAPVRVDDEAVSATGVRALLAAEPMHPRLTYVVPAGALQLLQTTTLRSRCAAMTTTEQR
jgi:nicotinamide-nucleotide adenylyltransferase